MSTVAFGFGVFWLIAGMIEMNTALLHSKQHGCKLVLFAAWAWLAIAAGALLVAFCTMEGPIA